MNVQILIYAYLFICASMIGFNVVCIFVFRGRDKNMHKRSKAFEKAVKEEIDSGEVSEKHKEYLMSMLRRVNCLMAFDEMLEQFYREDESRAKEYTEELSSVFIYLANDYIKKNKLKSAYFPYIIKKYGLFRHQENKAVTEAMLALVSEYNMYCRENALKALYSMGSCNAVVKALRIINKNSFYHNQKVITDGLLSFTGDHKLLSDKLWAVIDEFCIELRVAILNYFRFRTENHCENMMKLITEKKQNREVLYSCIRYFGKHRYEPAYPLLLELAEDENKNGWEGSAIACTALASYPSENTIEVLKNKLHSRNWYVRANASKSLEELGLDYIDLIDIFEGDDRYATEILRYRFDQKKMQEKEAFGV